VRIGSPVQAMLKLKDVAGTEVVKLKGDFGASGNNHYVNVLHSLDDLETGYAVAVEGNPRKVIFYDDGFESVREIELNASILSVVGVGVQQFPVGEEGKTGFWVLGTAAGGPTLWRYDEAGQLVPAATINLSASIPPGDAITGIIQAPMQPGDGIYITTNKHLLYYLLPAPGQAVLTETVAYSDFDGNPQDVSSGVLAFDISEFLEGADPVPVLMLLERTQKKVYAILATPGEPLELIGALDIASWVNDDSAEGIGIDLDSGDVMVAWTRMDKSPWTREENANRYRRFAWTWTSCFPKCDPACQAGRAPSPSGTPGTPGR